MFLDEILQLFGPSLLSLLIKLHSIVMLDYLLDTTPEELDHLGHIGSLAPQILLLLLQLLLLFYLSLT